MVWKIGCSTMGWNKSKYKTEQQVVLDLCKNKIDCVEVSGSYVISHSDVVCPYSIHANKYLLDWRKDDIIAYILMLRHACKSMQNIRIIMHPPTNYIIDYGFLHNICKGMTIGIETVSEASFKTVEQLSEHVKCELAIDFSHVKRLNFSFDVLSKYPVCNVHLRGSCNGCYEYVRVMSVKSEIYHWLEFLLSINYSGALILEYPYGSINEVFEDICYLDGVISKIY